MVGQGTGHLEGPDHQGKDIGRLHPRSLRMVGRQSSGNVIDDRQLTIGVGVKTGPFRSFLTGDLVPALAKTGALRDLRTQVFLPWIERLWNTPNVAHDNPTDQRFHASLILGFTDTIALRAFFGSAEIATLSGELPEFVSAVHAYEAPEALTYVKAGKILPHYPTQGAAVPSSPGFYA